MAVLARNPKRRGGRPRIETPSPVDVHVGSRLRLRRTLLGMSQEKLGAALGLTFQQVQKYERGTNRIGSSRLYDAALALDVPVAFFFEDMPIDDRKIPSTAASEASADRLDPMAKRETLELVRAYYRITDPTLRRRLFDVVKAAAKAAEPSAKTE
jgi:transcriptional regulator with XRE-family HTH domain